MSSILAFAGSNSSTSINYKLAKHTASLIENHKVKQMNMANYPFPLYSEDHEKENGFSNSLLEVMNDIKNADGLIVSVSEHNGNVSAYFKNFLDWLSRIDKQFLDGKKVLLMSTSPGKRAAIGAFEITNNILPRFGATAVIGFSLPSFYDNFDMEKGIIDLELSKAHKAALSKFLAEI
jgi:NAD(P)H-dependent FMN reductase